MSIWNGLGRQTNGLAAALSNSFDVTVFVPSDKSENFAVQQGQVRIVHVSKRLSPLHSDEWINACLAELKKDTFDFLIITSAGLWPIGQKYREHSTKTKLVSTVNFLYRNAIWLHTRVRSEELLELETAMLSETDILVSHSEMVASSVAVAAQREVYVVNNVVQVSTGVQPPYDPKPKTICCVGRIHRVNGFDVLLRAIHRMSTNVKLNIACPEYYSRFRYGNLALTQLVEKFQLQDRINFLGWINSDTAIALYRSSTVAVVVNSLEPFAYPVIDPLLLGTPVIASGFSGLSDYLLDPKNSYINIGELIALLEDKLNSDVNQERIDGITDKRFEADRITTVLEEILRRWSRFRSS
jgi:glycosyltransferase involved in cell wall biosynthesis